jgi:predicted nucleic acid-binding protein
VRVLIDTTLWSLALRRRRRSPEEQVLVDELAELIKEQRAVLIGPIRQEVLSGIPDARQFDSVRRHLAAFDDLPIDTQDYEEAARLFNVCRAQGIQGSHVDFLISAVAKRHSTSIFTTDLDFGRYANHIDLRLYEPPARRSP